MTLSFSTKWPVKMGELAGQPNNFTDKIWAGLLSGKSAEACYPLLYEWGLDWEAIKVVAPKFHTIREDSHNRWRPGMKIHPVINNRSKDRFQFAPVMECTGVQKISIVHYPFPVLGYLLAQIVKVDGRSLDLPEIEQLAMNDGFPSVDDFFAWFNEDFTGKIIHWTDLRY